MSHRGRFRSAAFGVGILVLTAPGAFGQTTAPHRIGKHAFVSVSAGKQVISTTVVDQGTVPTSVEQGSFTATFPMKTASAFGGYAGVRIVRNLAAVVGVSHVANQHSSSISAQIPHPFFFKQSRLLAGDVSGLSRDETAVDVDLSAMISAGRRIQINVMGGATVFRLVQDHVTAVNYSESYPYDTVIFTTADSHRVVKTQAGLNVAADVSYFLSQTIGVGTSVRLSNASGAFAGSTTAGRIQVGAGLRVRF